MDLGNVFGIDSCAENSLGNSENSVARKFVMSFPSFITRKYVTRPEKLSLATFWETSICENLFPTQTFHQLHFEQGRL